MNAPRRGSRLLKKKPRDACAKRVIHSFEPLHFKSGKADVPETSHYIN